MVFVAACFHRTAILPFSCLRAAEMFRCVAPSVRRNTPSFRPGSRSLATVLPASKAVVPSDASTTSSTTDDGTALRPQTNVQVDPNHGLWAFFRQDRQGKLLTLEPSHKTEDFSGEFQTFNGE